jgi:hypothetical protein
MNSTSFLAIIITALEHNRYTLVSFGDQSEEDISLPAFLKQPEDALHFRL